MKRQTKLKTKTKAKVVGNEGMGRLHRIDDGELDNGEVIGALNRDEVAAVAAFGREQAMALIGLYYSIQKVRIGASNKIAAHERQVDALSDSALIVHLKEDLHRVERQAARGLKAYAEAQPLGKWALSNIGVGPIICAGLLAHIDVTKASTAGAIWNFAGLNPDQVWEKGQKRPYNAALHTLCWKLGESFKRTSIKFSDELYQKLYRQRKTLEVQRNARGDFREAAAARLEKANKNKWRISPEQRSIWSDGKLQDRGLDLRAMRYTVKIFLSHYHMVGRELVFGEAPVPWIIAHGGHTHFIPPPNWPMKAVGVD